ncbi:monocyte chemotactic protein 1B [Taeniopygia guttata]|uniref:Monocyte chemotactic protein 1B-like n=1 Tax=Taeniopygia guttata TaxID=59729 RepID=H0ZT85_TAEGU|nr:monocyte chemotactic protein 1B [Taeniopygia guttata]
MKLHTTAILLLFWFGVFTVHTVRGSSSSESMRKFKCVNLSTRQLNIRNLVNYEKQQVPTDAIMFLTAGGIKICVRPNQEWVQAAIKRIDERRTAKPHNPSF